MLTISVIANLVLAAVAVVLVILYIRTKNFTPAADKRQLLQQVNTDLESTGFAYEPQGDYFYSLMNCWQRDAGYCKLYDEGASNFNMIMDCEPVTFYYAGKRWLIELWKGQYGITTGAEIGIYNTVNDDIQSEKFSGTFYESISDEERLTMSFTLRKNGRILIQRKALHWWITGFKLGEFSDPDELTMEAKIEFPNREMRDAFVEGLYKIGYHSSEFSVRRATVTVQYAKPHTQQPVLQRAVTSAAVQEVNKTNCGLFMAATSDYPDTLNKLEYLKAAMPELYAFFLHSLYAKGFFEAFEWLLTLLHGHRRPDPVPPRPCPPCPEPCPEPCPQSDPCSCYPDPEACPCAPFHEPCQKPAPRPSAPRYYTNYGRMNSEKSSNSKAGRHDHV